MSNSTALKQAAPGAAPQPTLVAVPEWGKVTALVQNSSFLRGKQHFANNDLVIEPVDDFYERVYGHWMSLILVAGQGLRITFKVQFSTAQVRRLASAAVSGDAKPELVIDLMREYCNLTAGLIKSQLESQAFRVGISLPLATRGFDEVYSTAIRNERSYWDCWRLRDGENSIVCSYSVDLLDPGFLDKLVVADATEQQPEDDIEFL